MVGDLWLVDFNPFCVFLCYKVLACDRNYDWRQQKMQLWRRLLMNFRVSRGCEKHKVSKSSQTWNKNGVKVNVRLLAVLAIQCYNYETIRMEYFLAISQAALLAA